jgi:inorganic phosphate transporter, PiT family
VMSGGVMGAGAATRLSAVRWGVAGNIAIAWVLTLPAAAFIGALAYGVSSIFGSGALGPVVVSLSILGVVLAFFGRRVARGQVLTADA